MKSSEDKPFYCHADAYEAVQSQASLILPRSLPPSVWQPSALPPRGEGDFLENDYHQRNSAVPSSNIKHRILSGNT